MSPIRIIKSQGSIHSQVLTVATVFGVSQTVNCSCSGSICRLLLQKYRKHSSLKRSHQCATQRNRWISRESRPVLLTLTGNLSTGAVAAGREVLPQSRPTQHKWLSMDEVSLEESPTLPSSLSFRVCCLLLLCGIQVCLKKCRGSI